MTDLTAVLTVFNTECNFLTGFLFGIFSEFSVSYECNDLFVNVFEEDRSEVPAVLRFGAEIAEDEYRAFGNDDRQVFFSAGVGGIDDLAALHGAVDHERAALADEDTVAALGNDSAAVGFPVGFIEDDIVLLQVAGAVAEGEVSVAEAREHIAARDDPEAEEDVEQHDCYGKQKHRREDAPQKGAVLFAAQNLSSAFRDHVVKLRKRGKRVIHRAHPAFR